MHQFGLFLSPEQKLSAWDFSNSFFQFVHCILCEINKQKDYSFTSLAKRCGDKWMKIIGNLMAAKNLKNVLVWEKKKINECP